MQASFESKAFLKREKNFVFSLEKGPLFLGKDGYRECEECSASSEKTQANSFLGEINGAISLKEQSTEIRAENARR